MIYQKSGLGSHPLRTQNMNALFTDFPLRVIVTVTQSTGFERSLQKCISYYNKADLFKASLNIAKHVLFLGSEENVILLQIWLYLYIRDKNDGNAIQ